MPIHEAFLDDHAGGRGRGGDAIDVRRIEREWLFAQHVLAGGDRRQRPRHVLGIGEGNVDGVDARIVEQRLIAGDGAWDRPLGGVAFGASQLAAGDRDQLAAPRAAASPG